MAKKTKKLAKPVKASIKPARKVARGASAAKRSAAKKGAPAKARKATTKARAKAVQAVPAGMHTVTPSMVVSDCAKALDFYREAFGAQELMRMMKPASVPGPDQVWHAALRIGDSVVFMSDPVMGMPAPSVASPATTSIYLYVPDCDAVFERAVKAGATVKAPMMDAFWGDRMGMLLDPFGVRWEVATHVKDMTVDEMRAGGEEFARTMATQGAGVEPPSDSGAQPAEAGSHDEPAAGQSSQVQGA